MSETFGEYLKRRRKEDAGLSREQAAGKMSLSVSKLEKIERDELYASAQDIVEMAEVYNAPELCSYFCANECEIGKQQYLNVSEAGDEDLAHIAVALLNSVNALNDQRNRFIEMSADDLIDRDELRDLLKIHMSLKQLSEVANTLNVWIKNEIIEGRIDEKEYEYMLESFEVKER